ncbi:MAG: chemotaxis protein CheW, partial [Chloroflexi bacterium]|nr:chemotaxis protein CheW [Chloroflexota bacterium]
QYLTLQECKLREQVAGGPDVRDLGPSSAAATAVSDGSRTPEHNGKVGSEVSSQVVEELIATVGRLVAEGATLNRVTTRLSNSAPAEEILRIVQEANGDWESARHGIESLLGGWSDAVSSLGRSENEIGTGLSRLHELARSLRLAPAAEILNPVRRFAQELAHRQGKLIELDLQGTDLELDRGVLHLLSEPLRRLVWFGVMHGIEDVERRQVARKSATGHLTVRLKKHDDHVQVVVEDDGQGIDREWIKQRVQQLGWPETEGTHELAVMLKPGFGKVSSNGGEGIDLAALDEDLRNHQGRMTVSSECGKGTHFDIRLPLDMTVVDGMIVRVGDIRYVVPVSTVRRIVHPESSDLVHSSAEGSATLLKFEDELVQVQNLAGDTAVHSGELMLVVDGEQERIALRIDELIGRQQVLVRPLQGALANVRDASGCALLGEGEVGVVLNRELIAG